MGEERRQKQNHKAGCGGQQAAASGASTPLRADSLPLDPFPLPIPFTHSHYHSTLSPFNLLGYRGEADGGQYMNQDPLEPFVDADQAAKFLFLTRRHVLELARAGKLPGYPIGGGARRVWRFRLSELAAAVSVRDNSELLVTRKPYRSAQGSRGRAEN